ncbi:AAA family ATPase [Streptomyces sp. NPDC059740]|uniref:helix-turn-helix transcriptional regulator n=1 Tax=Streptomyces sp. NPDC059740 TaxID=3346926 RepID=UPI00364B4B57
MTAEPGRRATARPLPGRRRETRAVTDAVAAARAGNGTAVVVVGEAGMGKSTLLARAADAAGDALRCAITGAAPERDLPLAALHRLLLPLRSHLPDLPRSAAAPLHEVLAGRPPQAGEFGAALALLHLFARATRNRPLVWSVDDAHQVDDASLRVLAVAARRLTDLPVLMLLATEPGGPAVTALEGLPTVGLAPLTPAAATELLAARVRADPLVLAGLADLAGGNPLALTELAALAGRAPAAVPQALPGTSRLRAHHRRRLQSLTPHARAVVWLALLGEGLTVPLLKAAGHRMGAGPAALDEALASGLVTGVEGGTVEVPGRLLRAGLLADLPLADRQAVHDALSQVLDPGSARLLRALHLLAASEETTGDLVREVDEATAAARADGAPGTAASVLEHAAEVTALHETSQRWLVTAAADRLAAGQPVHSRSLLRRVAPRCRATATAGLRMLVEGEDALRDGVPAAASRSLTTAAALFPPGQRASAARAFLLAGEASYLAGDFRTFFRLAERVKGERRPDDPPRVRLMSDHLVGMAATFHGRHAEATRALRNVVRLAGSLREPEPLTWASHAAYVLGEAARAHALAVAAVHEARQAGTVALVPGALVYQALSALMLDRYAAAEASALEGLRLAESTGQRNVAVDHLAVLALLAALQGDRASAALRVTTAARQVAARELGRPAAFTCWASACIDLVEDRPADALGRFGHMTTGVGQRNLAIRALATPHFVEAAARCDQRGRADGALHAFQNWAASSGSATRLALVQRCHGLLAGDVGTAEEHFREALRLHQESHTPLELAKTELFYAHRLRRARRPAAARGLLRDALTVFRQFEAGAWIEQTTAELRAAGDSVGPATPAAAGTELTAQQTRISRLVAQGATNREIAAHLVLSTRTVEYHLRNIFSRLGVRSRVELAARFR